MSDSHQTGYPPPWGARPAQLPARPPWASSCPPMCARCVRRFVAGAIYDVTAYGNAKGRSPAEIAAYAWWEADAYLTVLFGES